MEWDAQRVCAQLTQHNRFSTQTFTLYPNRLQVEISGMVSGHRSFMYFAGIKDQPDFCRWNRRNAMALMVATVIWALLALLFLLGRDTWKWQQWLAFSVVGCLPPVILVVRGLSHFRKVWVFAYTRTHEGVIPCFWLHPCKPSREVVNDFISKLQTAHRAWVEHDKGLYNATVVESSAETLRKFDDLRKEGMITDEEFLDVKDHLLHGGESRIGFR